MVISLGYTVIFLDYMVTSLGYTVIILDYTVVFFEGMVGLGFTLMIYWIEVEARETRRASFFGETQPRTPISL